MATSRPAGWSTAGPTRRNSASGFWKRRWGIEVDSVHDRFGVGVAIQILPAAKPWGGDRSRSEWWRGGDLAPLSSSVSASRCHLPIASRRGGSLYPYLRLLPLPLSVRVERSRDTQDRKSTRLNSSH